MVVGVMGIGFGGTPVGQRIDMRLSSLTTACPPNSETLPFPSAAGGFPVCGAGSGRQPARGRGRGCDPQADTAVVGILIIGAEGPVLLDISQHGAFLFQD